MFNKQSWRAVGLIVAAVLFVWLLSYLVAHADVPPLNDDRGVCNYAFDTAVQHGAVTADKRAWWVENCLATINEAPTVDGGGQDYRGETL